MDRETADALDALVDELRARADAGDRTAAERLTELLGQPGRGKKLSGCACSAWPRTDRQPAGDGRSAARVPLCGLSGIMAHYL
jgi:hypothetical protein